MARISLYEICVPACRHSERLTEFSHLLTQIKFIVLEIVIFIGFLMLMWER